MKTTLSFLTSTILLLALSSTAKASVFEREIMDSSLRVETQGTLSSSLLQQLKRLASDQAQIWADTILEGDYFADGKTNLDAVQALYKGQQLVGYKIIYSENAWYTGNCSFDGRSPATLRGCQPGRIQESSYVSADLKNFFTDFNNFATFIPAKPR